MIDPTDLRDVFDRVVTLPLADRSAFLDEACRDNAALRREIERLLDADARGGSAFDTHHTGEPSDESNPGQPPTLSLEPGTRLGPYQITAALGAGGMGEVYKARDTRLDRTVAIKVLSKGLTEDPTARRRFEREARAIAGLSHHHICPLFDVGHQDGTDFLVMEYLDGETLASRLARGKLPLDRALTYASEIAQALNAAHQAGIVHRDLKPGNVMLVQSGVMLLDFGLAKRQPRVVANEMDAPSLSVTRAGTILGTIQYMAPEQLEGRPADARADIFAFGAVLYEMLTSSRAFNGASAASLIGSILHDEPAVPSSITPTVPRQLDHLVRQCLAKDPAARPTSLAEVNDALFKVRDRVRTGRGMGTLARWARTPMRRRVALSGVLMVFVAVATVAGGRWLPRSPLEAVWRIAEGRVSSGDSSLPPMHTVPLTTLPGAEDSPSFSPDGTRIAFDSSQYQGRESRIVVKGVGDDHSQELTRGAFDTAPAWSPDGRLIAFVRNGWPRDEDPSLSGLYVVPAGGGPARRLHSASLYGGPAWSPDGRSLVFAAFRNGTGGASLFELSMTTFGTRRLTSESGWEWSPAFSPDGRTLAFVGTQADTTTDIYVMSSGGGTPKRVTSDRKPIWGRIAWSPDGNAIVFSSSRAGAAELWRIQPDGGVPERLPIAGSASRGVAFDRSGRHLAYVHGNAISMHINALDLHNRSGKPVAFAESSRAEHAASFSRDGKKVAFASNRGGDGFDVWMADADGTSPIRLTFFGASHSSSPQWSPDGTWVAFDSDTNKQSDVLVVNAAGGTPRRLTPEDSNESVPSWSRDGRWIYFASNRAGKDQVWKMPSQGGEAIQITKDGGYGAFESADGRFLYYTKADDEAGVWRIPVQGGLEEPVLPKEPTGAYRRDWALVRNGLYYLNTRNPGRQSLDFLDFSTRRINRVLDMPGSVCTDWTKNLTVSPDGRTLLTCFEGPVESDIMLVENFR
jgi:Tol biopolymer transport system component/serine/threonine protein kinase